MPLNFQKMFDDYVTSNDKEWAHDRSSTLGASEAFGCIRKAFFDKFGEELDYKPDEDFKQSWGALKRGDLIEDNWVVPVMEDQISKQVPGAVLLMAGANDQKTFVKGRNSATPDGLITNLPSDALAHYGIEDMGSDCLLTEIKSVDPRVSLTEEKSIHEGQVQIQMGLIREMTEYKPNYAVIIYVDASFFDNMKVFVVEFNESTFRAATVRAKQLFQAEDPIDLLPEGKIEGTCQYCRWKTMCAEAAKGSIPVGERKDAFADEELITLEELLEQEKEISQNIKEFEHDKEKIRARIKQTLVEKDTKRVNTNTYSVSYTWQKGRKSLDKSRLEKETGIKLDQYEKEGTGFEKLTIRAL